MQTHARVESDRDKKRTKRTDDYFFVISLNKSHRSSFLLKILSLFVFSYQQNGDERERGPS